MIPIKREGSGVTRTSPSVIPADPFLVPKPPGYGVQVRSHNAVCAAVKHERADWGVVIETVAMLYELETISIALEQYDFVIPKSRRNRPAVRAFLAILDAPRSPRRTAGRRFPADDPF